MPTAKRNGKYLLLSLPHIELTLTSQEENWYKPQPGEPYRPLIALPSKLKEMVPWLSHCGNEFFTAYDPPTALKAGAALAAPSLSNDPQAPSWTPVPTPTLDTGARQTVDASASVPVPANVPTLRQPMATDTATSAPTKQKGPDPERQSNTPTVRESPLPQPRPITSAINSDPNQGSGNNGDFGQQEDPKLNNNPNQVNNNQGSNENADEVLQNDPKQSNEANPFEIYTEGRAKTINNLVVQPLSHGISIAGTTLKMGASPITVSGTPIHYGSSALVVGTSTVPLAPEVPTWIMNPVVGQAITEAPNAATVAGTTLRPGAPGITLAGTLISLDAASQLMIGSKIISLESASQSSIVTNIGGQAISAAPNGISIAGTAQTPDASNVFVGKTLVSLNTAGQLIVGSKTITLQNGRSGLGGLITGGLDAGGPSGVEDPLVNTIDGQVITATPTALAMAVTALTPGDPGLTINGVVVSLNTAAQLVVGSKTIPLEESASSSGQTAGLAGSTMGAFESGAPYEHLSTVLPTSTQNNSSTGAKSNTRAGTQISQGNAMTLRGSSVWRDITVVAIAIFLLAYVR